MRDLFRSKLYSVFVVSFFAFFLAQEIYCFFYDSIPVAVGCLIGFIPFAISYLLLVCSARKDYPDYRAYSAIVAIDTIVTVLLFVLAAVMAILSLAFQTTEIVVLDVNIGSVGIIFLVLAFVLLAFSFVCLLERRNDKAVRNTLKYRAITGKFRKIPIIFKAASAAASAVVFVFFLDEWTLAAIYLLEMIYEILSVIVSIKIYKLFREDHNVLIVE